MKSQGPGSPSHQASALAAATFEDLPYEADALVRARAFAEPLLAGQTLDTGENVLAHADAVAAILATMGGSDAMQSASYLVYACEHLNKPHEVIAKAFGAHFADLAIETTKLVRLQRMARIAQTAAGRSAPAAPMAQTSAAQTESVRKMLLAFSRDLRVVMLRLASRLQTLRHFAATKLPLPAGLAAESMQVFAPLANRLGRGIAQAQTDGRLGELPLQAPYRLDECGWVANRWAELLPLSAEEKMALLAQPDPQARLVQVAQVLGTSGD